MSSRSPKRKRYLPQSKRYFPKLNVISPKVNEMYFSGSFEELKVFEIFCWGVSWSQGFQKCLRQRPRFRPTNTWNGVLLVNHYPSSVGISPPPPQGISPSPTPKKLYVLALPALIPADTKPPPHLPGNTPPPPDSPSCSPSGFFYPLQFAWQRSSRGINCVIEKSRMVKTFRRSYRAFLPLWTRPPLNPFPRT